VIICWGKYKYIWEGYKYTTEYIPVGRGWVTADCIRIRISIDINISKYKYEYK